MQLPQRAIGRLCKGCQRLTVHQQPQVVYERARAQPRTDLDLLRLGWQVRCKRKSRVRRWTCHYQGGCAADGRLLPVLGNLILAIILRHRLKAILTPPLLCFECQYAKDFRDALAGAAVSPQ